MKNAETKTEDRRCLGPAANTCYKNYLSMGFGVNSVAMYLMLLKKGIKFEAVYSNHGADWPETAEYVKIFTAKHPVTILNPTVSKPFGDGRKTWRSLIEYCSDRKIIPQQWPRWCTGDWKKDVVSKYVEKPCFMFIGIDAGEAHRAKIHSNGRIEYRWPLIEEGIDREGCKQIIKDHGLPVPPKSGCYICPFQRPSQWKRLRHEHPNLFCIAEQLEQNSGRTYKKGQSLKQLVKHSQEGFWPEQYPPCECGL
ncbi:MAG TPA: hypothetical protein EYP35_09420 [Desulfobacterales bacterium]|nr:hypothetical protein [Desulfobacterales bacterium]HIP38987.1 hypothetical protein [Desulfocapsa sulfexigens]